MQDKKEKGLERFQELSPEGTRALQNLLGEIAPELLDIVYEFPFGDLYTRTNLDMKVRQATTLGVLAALNREPELKIHVEIAKNLGFSREELVEVFTQCAPYAGFPATMLGIRLTKEAFEVDK